MMQKNKMVNMSFLKKGLQQIELDAQTDSGGSDGGY